MCGHRRLPWPRSRCRQDPSVRHDDLRLAARGACRQSYGQASRSCCRQRTAPPGVPAARATWAHPTSASPMRYPWSIPTLSLLRSFAMVASPSALAPRSLCDRDRRVVGDWRGHLRPGLAARTGGVTWICGGRPEKVHNSYAKCCANRVAAPSAGQLRAPLAGQQSAGAAGNFSRADRLARVLLCSRRSAAGRTSNPPARLADGRVARMAFDDLRMRDVEPEGRGCAGSRQATSAQHHAAMSHSTEAALSRTVEEAIVRALFPRGRARRAFLRAVGGATALAAIAQVFPLGLVKEVFAAALPEKKDLRVGFIPITCATPIIMAHPLGFYAKHGLNVEVVKTAGWAVIRDKTLNKEYDAAHMLSPMPLAITVGAGSNPIAYTMPAVENINGQAITLAIKHKDKRDPKTWKGFKFAVPFDYSMHNYLLRYYVAEHGLDPDTDIQIRAVPPPEMVANLRADNIDGFLGPDPFNQRAVFDGVGFIHLLSKELW